jgi:hypothetical protein
VEQKSRLLSNGRRAHGRGKEVMKKFFKGHMVRKGGDEKSFGDHDNQESIFSDYMEMRGGDSLTVRFGEEVMEKQHF